MVKITDIAKATGCSVATVSRAFNNYPDINKETRARILKVGEELGYTANAQARGLVMKRSFTIGVILQDKLDLGLSHPFYCSLIQSFRQVVESKGYSMILITNQIGNSNIGSYLAHCNQINVDAVFIMCTDVNNKGIQELIKSKIPTVLFDILNDESHSVCTNHYQGAFDATEFLIEKNHKKICFIYDRDDSFVGTERKRGFIDAMNKHKIKINKNYIVAGGEFDFESGKKAMNTILENSIMPTALFASCDIFALGAIQACYEKNINVPNDISIIGFDNLKLLEWITPSLTTVAQDYDSVAKACCELLISSIDNKSFEITHKVFDTKIIKRDSCIRI